MLLRTILLLFLALPLLAFAQLTGEASATAVSTYVFRGLKVTDATIQPAVQLALGSAYATVWASQPVKSQQDREVDFTAGLNPKLSSVTLDLGVTAYTYQSAGTTWEQYAGVSTQVGDLKPSLTVYRDWTLKTTTYQGGIAYPQKLDENLTATPKASFGVVDGSYRYWEAGVELAYAVRSLTTFAGASYASSDVRTAKRDLVVGTAGVRLSF
jgi:uncharacterized protein (TIGR02001 family)